MDRQYRHEQRDAPEIDDHGNDRQVNRMQTILNEASFPNYIFYYSRGGFWYGLSRLQPRATNFGKRKILGGGGRKFYGATNFKSKNLEKG